MNLKSRHTGSNRILYYMQLLVRRLKLIQGYREVVTRVSRKEGINDEEANCKLGKEVAPFSFQ